MRSSSILPAEHLLALAVNLGAISFAALSAFFLFPPILHNNAKLNLLSLQLQHSHQQNLSLSHSLKTDLSHPQRPLRDFANLSPHSRISLILLK